MTQLVGVFRIGKDAELRTAGNTSVINLALASNYGKRDSSGNKPTQWVDAALFGKRAEALEQYLLKGQQVYCVLNDVHIDTYEKRDGGTASKLVGSVIEIELIGGKPAGERQERERPRAEPRREEPKREPQRSSSFDDMDDDIPF